MYDSVLFGSGNTSPNLAYNLAMLLSHLADTDPIGGVRNALPQVWQTSDQFNFFPINSLRASVLSVTGNDAAMLLFKGTEGTTHVQALLSGWTNYNNPVQPSGGSRAFVNAVNDPAFAPVFGLIGGSRRLYLVGHSYGGATAQVFAAMMRATINPQIRGVWSFGAPRAGTPRLEDALNGIPNTRWFNSDDPVRWVPPHYDECASLNFVLGSPTNTGMNEQVTIPVGYQIAPDGTISQTEGAVDGLVSVGLSLASWITGTNAFGNPQHSLAEYMRRFLLAVQNAPLPIVPHLPTNQDAPERPSVTVRARFLAQGQADVARDATLSGGTTGTLMVGNNTGMKRDRVYRYTRKRMGHTWVVMYQGQVVASCTSKKEAKVKVRELNAVAMQGTVP